MQLSEKFIMLYDMMCKIFIEFSINTSLDQ